MKKENIMKEFKTEHFTLKELCKTNTGLKNEPDAEQIENLKTLMTEVLEPIRIIYGEPIRVNSGFRSKEVNKKVGGVPTSQHAKGEAADITCKDNKKLFDICKKFGKYDQLIWEYGNTRKPAWVHISYKREGVNRKQILYIGVSK